MFRYLWLDGTGVEWNDARVNLLAADLSGLPPTAIYYGTDELLAGEATELAKRAQAAGNDVLLRPVPAGQHSFIVAAGRVPEVDQPSKKWAVGCDPNSDSARARASGDADQKDDIPTFLRNRPHCSKASRLA